LPSDQLGHIYSEEVGELPDLLDVEHDFAQHSLGELRLRDVQELSEDLLANASPSHQDADFLGDDVVRSAVLDG
jgi:hypothetical protein